jgi:hypothetical protein
MHGAAAVAVIYHRPLQALFRPSTCAEDEAVPHSLPHSILYPQNGENGYCSPLQQFPHPVSQNADPLVPPPKPAGYLSSPPS